MLTVYGTTTIQTPVNSPRAFRVINAASSTVFTVDTANTRVGIATGTPARTLSVTSTGTTTIYLDSTSGTQGTCLKMKNATGTDYTFVTVEYGVLVASTISCE